MRCLGKTISYISRSTKCTPPIFFVKLSLFLLKLTAKLAIIELFSLAIGLIFGYYPPCCVQFGCHATADFSHNMSISVSTDQHQQISVLEGGHGDNVE